MQSEREGDRRTKSKVRNKFNLIRMPQFVVHYQWPNWSDVTSLGTMYLEVEGGREVGKGLGSS